MATKNGNVKIQLPPGIKFQFSVKITRKQVDEIFWSADGEKVASLFSDRTVEILDIQTKRFALNLRGDAGRCIAWSPKNRQIASGGTLGLIIWDVETGKQLKRFLYGRTIKSVSWSPDGKFIAATSNETYILDVETDQILRILQSGTAETLAWSPDGRTLAIGTDVVQLWNVKSGVLLQIVSLDGHNLIWSSDGRMLVRTSDVTIKIIDFWLGKRISILEGHTNRVIGVSFSYDNRLLASQDNDNTIMFWNMETKEAVLNVKEEFIRYKSYVSSPIAFHPFTSKLAVARLGGRQIDIWDLDLATIINTKPIDSSVYYTNAKVVLVGDSGVGKSGLGLVLAGKDFKATESTHGRHVWTFDRQEVMLDGDRKEIREILLWDLAGQPGYRLIHQLHLNEIVIALVVFDARSETDPFAGVYHWDRALRLAQNAQGNSMLPLKKILIAGRMDRGGSGVSRSRIDTLLGQMDYDYYIETSAKEGWGIKDLVLVIQNSLDWEKLPRVSSTALFQRIKDFLMEEKSTGRLLSTTDDLYRLFERSEERNNNLDYVKDEFMTCIGRVESRDLIKQLSFGNLVLLQPELLDMYASALVNAVKDEPDGLGSILEENAINRLFRIPSDERIKDGENEKLLIIAVIEQMMRQEIALREQGEDGSYLVFPSQSTRENPDMPDPKGKSIIFSFEGPIVNIYATLAVRLSHSKIFRKKDLWKDAITYVVYSGGTCGLFLRNLGEGRGEITLFFDEEVSEETRFYFDQYVEDHLKKHSLPNTLHRQRIFSCMDCGTLFSEAQVNARQEKGYDWIRCSVCDVKTDLLDKEKRLDKEKFAKLSKAISITDMNVAADVQRERQVADTVLEGRMEIGDFDVFLCYNSEDKARVMEIGKALRKRGILPWLDEWELRPGLPWQRLLEMQIKQIRSAAIFVGKNGVGPWQQLELEAFLREFVRMGKPVIPVILANAKEKPLLPVFLKGMTWVDFRKKSSSPMGRLVWGITGKREIT